MIDVPRERIMILSCWDLFSVMTAYRVAGMIRDEVATVISDDIVDATVELKDCSGYLRPPAKKQQPRTRRMLDRMLPSMLACTIRISLARSAMMLT